MTWFIRGWVFRGRRYLNLTPKLLPHPGNRPLHGIPMTSDFPPRFFAPADEREVGVLGHLGEPD